MTNVPFLPNITPWVLPQEPFEQLIARFGIRLSWLKSHACACTFSGSIIGSPDPNCKQCNGLAYYWDKPSAPFFGLMTFVHATSTADQPGFFTDEKVGIVQHGEPILTIPYTADSIGQIWTEAGVYDAYVELDAVSKHNAVLQVGGVTAVPYQQNLSIDPAGAVTVYSPVTNLVTSVSGYTVSGATVTLPSSYPEGTSYVVEFLASPVYIAYNRAGGGPHIRPFGGIQMQLPRRFKLQMLDLWIRARMPYPNSTSPNAVLASVI